MTDEIMLPLGATAEPDTCGSCRFFVRMGDFRPVGQGRCGITLPPGIASKYEFKVSENSYEFDRMNDYQRCDLQRPDGKVYIVQRRIGKTA